MRKALGIMVAMLFVCGIALASVGIQSDKGLIGVATDIYFGTGFSSSGMVDGSLYQVNVTTGAVASITSGTIAGTTINSSVIGGVTPAAATVTSLTATGVITDVALYSKDSGAYPVHLTKVGADGTIYGSGNGTVLRELGLINASKGTGAGRMVCASTTDGAIYTIGSGSCF